jgi:two-component system sensor histidine kinase YesM
MTLSDSAIPHKIKDEVSYAENYIKLQNMRFQDMFFLEVKLEERMLEIPIISMVLQPIIENSIEHGLKERGVPLHIVVNGKIICNKDALIQICDDGKGMSSDRINEINHNILNSQPDKLKLEQKEEETKTGIGLKNIAERIKLYYGDKYYLNVVQSDEEGTVIEICIPIQWEKIREGDDS